MLKLTSTHLLKIKYWILPTYVPTISDDRFYQRIIYEIVRIWIETKATFGVDYKKKKKKHTGYTCTGFMHALKLALRDQGSSDVVYPVRATLPRVWHRYPARVYLDVYTRYTHTHARLPPAKSQENANACLVAVACSNSDSPMRASGRV